MASRATISDWFAIGSEAAREGRMRVPAHDPRIVEMLEAEPCKVGSAQSVAHTLAMFSWLEGYDAELCRQVIQAHVPQQDRGADS